MRGSDGAVLIRDTKDCERGPVLSVSPEAWASFTASLSAAPVPVMVLTLTLTLTLTGE
jgi:hypothetical protein